MPEAVLVMQSGGSTGVLNRSLYGIAAQVKEQLTDVRLLGARCGVGGLLTGELIDLDRRSKSWWDRIARTPGAALGSTRKRLENEDAPAALDVLAKHNVRYLFLIGGNDSAETALALSDAAGEAGMALSVIHVPKTIDNDLVKTDHTPGYGSAARFVALATMGAGRDAEAMGKESPVAVIEVMGRDAGWLPAAAVLGKREERDAPHVICVPEVPVDEERLLADMERAYLRFGFAVAVVSENARGPDGVLGGRQEPWYVDDFGHAYFEGAGRHIASAVGRHLGVRVRYEKPGTVQRSMAALVSRSDAREAEMAGRDAVRYALEGATGQMVTLVRGQGELYSCATGLAPLGEVAGRVKRMPDDWLDGRNNIPGQAFVDYAAPLVGPLPRFERVD